MNMKTGTAQSKENDFSHQQGIALVMVLGLLSLMIMLAVAFAISMRTERVAAGNYLDTVRANHLVRSALHLAMAHIYSNLHLVDRESCSVDIASSQIVVSNASLYPKGFQIALHNMLWKNYPIYSIPVTPTTIQIASNISDAMAGNYIDLTSYPGIEQYNKIIKRANPYGYPYPNWGATSSYSINNVQRPISLTNNALSYIPASLISAVTAVDYASQSNYWINIDTVVNGKTTTVGRVAYLIANCSGLLDANYAGGSNRSDGTHPAEIAIEYLDEIGDAGKQSFIDYRAANGSFETLPKLAGWKPSWHPSNMFCYSGFLENEWDSNRLDVSQGKVDISGDATNLIEKKLDIISAFWASGLTNTGEAGTAYTNLVDYVDTDSYAGNERYDVPKDLHASVEAVPMINEIMLSNTVTIVGSSNYFLANSIVVELSYPFSFNNPAPFCFELEAAIAPDHPSYPNFTLPSISISTTVTCSFASFHTFVFQSTASVVLDPLKLPPSELKWKETITKARVIFAGQVVDQLDNSPSCTVTSSLAAGTNFVSQMSTECVDPRFNWDTDSSNQWSSLSANQSSIGDINLITKNYWLSYSDCDKAMNMEVANRRLQSVSELTHLIYSTHPWKTIDPSKHKVNDYFCLGKYPIMRGFVNPNTHLRDVLASAFFNVLAYTNGVGRTDRNDAEIIADVIMNNKGQGYRTLQEVLSVILNPANSIPAYIDKYILISKTEKLLNLRQNLFVIIIEAQVASEGNFPRNPAKQKAVAIVWRDPFRDNMYVRSLIFLE